MMVTLAIMGSVGVLLGFCFNVLVLVPALLLSSFAVIFVTANNGSGPWLIASAVALTISVLELGYLAGTVIQSATGRAPGEKASPAAMTMAQPRSR